MNAGWKLDHKDNPDWPNLLCRKIKCSIITPKSLKRYFFLYRSIFVYSNRKRTKVNEKKEVWRHLTFKWERGGTEIERETHTHTHTHTHRGGEGGRINATILAKGNLTKPESKDSSFHHLIMIMKTRQIRNIKIRKRRRRRGMIMVTMTMMMALKYAIFPITSLRLKAASTDTFRLKQNNSQDTNNTAQTQARASNDMRKARHSTFHTGTTQGKCWKVYFHTIVSLSMYWERERGVGMREGEKREGGMEGGRERERERERESQWFKYDLNKAVVADRNERYSVCR